MKFTTVLLLVLLAIFTIVESSRLRSEKGRRNSRRDQRARREADARRAAAKKKSSDIQLKTDLKMVSTLPNGVEVYSWTWNKIAEAKGLSGKSVGVIAQQVQNIVPGSVSRSTDGFMKVDYSLIFTQ